MRGCVLQAMMQYQLGSSRSADRMVVQNKCKEGYSGVTKPDSSCNVQLCNCRLARLANKRAEQKKSRKQHSSTHGAFSSSCTGARALVLFVSTMQPFISISSRMKWACRGQRAGLHNVIALAEAIMAEAP